MARLQRVQTKPATSTPNPTNDNGPSAALTLTLNNHAIRDRGEMLSLTDMWKAAGEDASKRPYEWSRHAGADFIRHMEDVLNTGTARILEAGRGRGGQTFAHWQIALAYAKYLSPAFHAACNVVIRERMEGRPQVPAIPGDLAEEIHRILGINKMLSHKVTVIERNMEAMQEQHVAALVALDPRVAALAYVSVNEILDKEWKVPPKGRRSIQRRVLNRLKDYCATGAMKGTRAAYSGTWIFPRQDAIDFAHKTCGAMIRDHIDKVTGQTVLKLVRTQK